MLRYSDGQPIQAGDYVFDVNRDDSFIVEAWSVEHDEVTLLTSDGMYVYASSGALELKERGEPYA